MSFLAQVTFFVRFKLAPQALQETLDAVTLPPDATRSSDGLLALSLDHEERVDALEPLLALLAPFVEHFERVRAAAPAQPDAKPAVAVPSLQS